MDIVFRSHYSAHHKGMVALGIGQQERRDGSRREKGRCAVGRRGDWGARVKKEALAREGLLLPRFFLPIFLLSQIKELTFMSEISESKY